MIFKNLRLSINYRIFPKKNTGRRFKSNIRILLLLGFVLLSVIVLIGSGSVVHNNTRKLTSIRPTWLDQKADTVVLYVFGGDDPYYQGNLLYFLRHGIVPDIDYVIILQGGWKNIQEIVQKELRARSNNIQIIVHENACYDWGTYGWYLKKNLHKFRQRYKYIILMNSSVRGPFQTSYSEDNWVNVLQQQLDKQKDVKLLGASINCELFKYFDLPENDWRYNAHVQSFLLIMKFKTLEILLHDPYIFQCHTKLAAAIHYGEFGSSLAILNAGYNIASLQLRYEGVDWRYTDSWKCNGVKNPTQLNWYDGLNISPFETMFVKAKSTFQGTTKAAVRLSIWQEQIRGQVQNITTTKADDIKDKSMGANEIEFRAKRHCWDAIYYYMQNPDLRKQGKNNLNQLWGHFLKEGYIHGRKYRFNC
eukprot:TRINITY_DN532_c0_g2_i1.p1 TRINITY_DN532_c0_g2~~TRINITY_DN532_c0_g2_i1.p1  ORF type:complete len:419 (-),score=10.73 TRINITY_DN532_c0_g2_i1:1857-3113(-)